MSLSSPTPDPIDVAGPTPAGLEVREQLNTPNTGPAKPESPQRRRRARRLAKAAEADGLTGAQRLLLLDTWRRSGLPAGDFAPLVGVSKHTLYSWKHKFETEGPAGLEEKPRGGPSGSRLPEVTKRTILMLKQDNPEWGCERISSMLLRGPALPASPQAVARVLHEAGYELEEAPTHRHPDRMRRFERARPNQLWQTDLFTFVLKRQNRRVYLVAFMDDHSRFLVSYGLHASQSSALVMEVLRAGWLPTEDARAATAIAAIQDLFRTHGRPLVLKSDNGSPFIAAGFRSEMGCHGVWQLFSPPAWPRYNGSCEAGIGSMKARTHHQSVRRGFPGQWTCDDLEAARRQANELVRPWGHHGPTPVQAWQSRKPISGKERQKFVRTVRACVQQHEMHGASNRLQRERLQREALAQALVRHGLLKYTSESVPTPYPPRRRRRKKSHSSG